MRRAAHTSLPRQGYDSCRRPAGVPSSISIQRRVWSVRGRGRLYAGGSPGSLWPPTPYTTASRGRRESVVHTDLPGLILGSDCLYCLAFVTFYRSLSYVQDYVASGFYHAQGAFLLVRQGRALSISDSLAAHRLHTTTTIDQAATRL